MVNFSDVDVAVILFTLLLQALSYVRYYIEVFCIPQLQSSQKQSHIYVGRGVDIISPHLQMRIPQAIKLVRMNSCPIPKQMYCTLQQKSTKYILHEEGPLSIIPIIKSSSTEI